MRYRSSGPRPRSGQETHRTNPETVQSVSPASLAGQEGPVKRQCDQQTGLKRPRSKCNSAQRSSPLNGGETDTPWMVIPAEAEDAVFLARSRSHWEPPRLPSSPLMRRPPHWSSPCRPDHRVPVPLHHAQLVRTCSADVMYAPTLAGCCCVFLCVRGLDMSL